MQNAYASYQFTQLIGRFSLLTTEGVHVAHADAQTSTRLVLVGATLLLSDASQPGSYVAPASSPTPASPLPPFTCACLPEPSDGFPPAPLLHELTNCRKRPTVTRYLSSRKLLTGPGSVRR